MYSHKVQTEDLQKAQRDLFEEELIKRIADMKDPEDKAVRFMAVSSSDDSRNVSDIS